MGFERCVQLVATVLLVANVAWGRSTGSVTYGNVEEKPMKEGCKKDLLLILDTSHSVGKRHFNEQVKPFLKDLVKDKTLNVGPDGTQISLMVYSSYSDPASRRYRKSRDKTKVLIPFSDNYDADALKDYISRMDWRDVKGGHTRTDKALEIANTKIFPQRGPMNNRRTANDVVILITDGEPRGSRTAVLDAVKNAHKLKKKGVYVIGIGVGKKVRERRFWNLINSISTPGHAMRVEFDKIGSIRDMLARQTCQKPAIKCQCPEVASAPVYLEPEKNSVQVSWQAPTPSCQGVSKVEVEKTIVQPSLTSPHMFEAGKHTIRYRFVLKDGQDVNCSVSFDVKACSCPTVKVDPFHVKPGESKAEVSWQVPVPRCLNYQEPRVHHRLSIGAHSVNYTYNVDTFQLICKVNVEVKGALCSDNGYDTNKQVCCGGVLHDKKSGFECCGHDLYDTSTRQCCGGCNIRRKDEDCPQK